MATNGPGLVFDPVEHSGNSVVEAEQINRLFEVMESRRQVL